MASRDPQATQQLALQALALSGQRGVLLTGWAGMGTDRDLPPHVFAADSIPHGWLFPQMAAVVHHGGAGTPGARLPSGGPAGITPLAPPPARRGRARPGLGDGDAPLPLPPSTAGQ